jgi:glycosyltransferase involved in cell wall biosynthesis
MNKQSEAARFRTRLREELENSLLRGQSLIPPEERLRIDLHCHDRNSDKPDERLGRMLGVPETWVTTEELLATLRQNGTDLVTVTNHNNARTCWDLMERGMDVLPGAEFSCTLPDFKVGIHVLTYGFTPAQEERLAVLRKDVYRFVDYCNEHDLVTVLAHPLQFHSPEGLPPMEVMDRLGLLFERFEAVNGQRDAWQNVLTAAWVEGMDEEEIHAMARRARQPVDLFARRPYSKSLTGGSDDHMAMYAGSTGTYLRIPRLDEHRKSGRKLSDLALQALRDGATAPYGGANEEEKLAAALLDYFCQVVLHMDDPGLLRILLHKGEPAEKALALAVANGAMELRRHSVTMHFLRTVHGAFRGQAPGFAAKFATNKDFRPLLDILTRMAKARRKGSNELSREVDTALPALYSHLGKVLAGRVAGKSRQIGEFLQSPAADPANLISRLELPSHLRALAGAPGRKGRKRPVEGPNLANLADGLPYPLLAASVIAGSQFAAARVLHEKRPFLDSFAERLGKHRHPHRALWLTDTFGDRNGVSSVLRQTLDEIRLRDLPIDILAVSDTLVEEPNLRVLRPAATFETPAYPQPIRVPDLLQVQKLFHGGGYDRIVCSTEGPMGLVALYLKHAFEVPAWFYVHTDWMDFARRTLGWDRPSLSRLRRLLRAYYNGFDGLFVLNKQMEAWLAGDQMNVPADRLHSTAHWPDQAFSPLPPRRSELFPGVLSDEMVLLYAGRISEEKGVLELPSLLQRLRERGVKARLAFAGSGPQEERLKELVPDGFFLGWCDQARLATAYSSADLLVLPSRFDTFGCVVVEAMACGLPVAAYAVQGPADIIEPGISGILAQTLPELAQRIAEHFATPHRLEALRSGALKRASRYTADGILRRFVADLGLGDEPVRVRRTQSTGNSDPAGFLGGLLELVQGT